MKEYISRSKDDLILRKKNRRDIMWRMENEKADAKLMAKSENGGLEGTDQLQSMIDSSKGNGKPLGEATKTEMEGKMNADLSEVKVHTDSKASEMADGINAKAFTYGQDIYFNQDNYNTSTKEGKGLLAHELTHTQQQKNGLSRKVNEQTPGEDLLGKTKVVPGTNVKTGNQTPLFTQLIDKFKTTSKPKTNQTGGFAQVESDLKAKISSGLVSLKSNPVVVDDANMEMIANIAAKEVQKSIGNFVGVNPLDITFKMADKDTPSERANLSGLDQNQLEGKGKTLKANIKIQLEVYISAKYAGMDLNFKSTEYDAMIDSLIKEFGIENLRTLPQILLAGETSNFEGMELRRNSYSDDMVIFRMLQSYHLNVEEITLLQQVVENVSKDAQGDEKIFFDSVLSYTQKNLMEGATAASIDYTFEGEAKDTGKNIKTDSHEGESRKLDDVIGKIIAMADSKTAPDQNQMTELMEAFKKSSLDTAKEGNEEFILGSGIRNKDVLMRYGLFQTVIHEFCHYICHPQYKAYADTIKDAQLYNILIEGVLDVFALDVWNKFKNSLGEKGDDDESLYARSYIEGWAGLKTQPGFVTPPLKKEWIQNYYLYDSAYAANALKNKIGIDNLKAAFFLGHIELLELDTTTTDKAYGDYIDSAKKGQADNLYLMPPSPAHTDYNDYTSTFFQIAFERGIYTKLEGSEKETAFDEMIAELGTKSKNKSRVDLLESEKALSASQAAWEVAKKDTNKKPEEKTEIFNKYITDQEKLLESKKSRSSKEAYYADKINYYHKGTQTIVIRDSDSVIALEDSKLEEFITVNKDRKLKTGKGEERWETWFKKQVPGTPNAQNTPTANTKSYETFNLPPNH